MCTGLAWIFAGLMLSFTLQLVYCKVKRVIATVKWFFISLFIVPKMRLSFLIWNWENILFCYSHPSATSVLFFASLLRFYGLFEKGVIGGLALGEDSRRILRNLQTEQIMEARSIYLPVPGSPRANIRKNYGWEIVKRGLFIDSQKNSLYYFRLQGRLADSVSPAAVKLKINKI